MGELLDIYAIQHNVTDRIYVGITEDVGRRVKLHFSELKGHRHHNYEMQKDFDEFGFDYSVFVLEFSVLPGNRWKERYYIETLHTDDPAIGYNGNDPRYARSKTKEGWRFVEGFPRTE